MDKDKSRPEEKKDENVSMDTHESYEKSFKTIRVGDYLKGKVVKITDTDVYVDIGYKQEGRIPLEELSYKKVSHPKDVVKVGDEIYVIVRKTDGDDLEGEVILSKKIADRETAWRKVVEAYEKGEVITATVVEAVKGGLLVDLGHRGFVPASQVDLRPVKDLEEFVGEALKLKVIEIDNNRRKVVLSRKKVLEEERIRQKEKTLNSLSEGQIVQGTVARLTNFGAFINLGGVDGLVHISEIAWKRIKHPSEVLNIGDKVDVMVLKVDREQERISLSRRQALPDPWLTIDESIKVNSIIKGKVTKIAKKYVFVEVAEGVEGVIPISELSDERNIKPSDVVKVGEEVEVKVLELDKDARRMVLSLKQAKDGGDSDISTYSSRSEKAETATIGEILKAKMKAAQGK